MSEMSDPAHGGFAVTPSDTANLSGVRSLYIGVTGDVRVVLKGSVSPVTFKAHPVGYMPARIAKVMATGTTATDILALT